MATLEYLTNRKIYKKFDELFSRPPRYLKMTTHNLTFNNTPQADATYIALRK